MQRITRKFDDYPDYFVWLCEIVHVDTGYSDESFWSLAKILWNTDFIWILDMDLDRAEDGIALRERYSRIGGTYNYSGPCTVLEMLIALADRMDCVLDELDGECKIPLYFWEMINNLGLSSYSDLKFTQNEDQRDHYYQEIDAILDNWMNRNIGYDGMWGLFPLRNPKEDQRDIDIWYQANAYMLENY